MTLFNKYAKLIKRAKELTRPRVEKNIFSIGGRGHYENPITDLLAFFIDSSEEHELGGLFLESLFQSAQITPPFLQLSAPPCREKHTNQGNRIDLILESEDWVLVIENKVWHQTVNPFDDYVQYARSSYKEKEIYFILLSIREEKPPSGWYAVNWRTYVDQIKKNMGEYFTRTNNVKWHILMREYLLNIEREYGDNSMSDERIEFVKSNYVAIQELEEMYNEYITHMANRGIKVIKEVSSSKEVTVSKMFPWNELGKKGVAVRFFSNDWRGGTNVVLVLRKDSSLMVRCYVYDISDEQVGNLLKHFDEPKFNKIGSSSPMHDGISRF